MIEFFTSFNLSDFVSSFLVLFAIMNMPGSVPVILNLEKKGKIINAKKAGLAVFTIYFSFFFAGEVFLKLFGVDISSFAIAGAIIVFIIGLSMTLDINLGSDTDESSSYKDATIVPVVFPLLVGAGALTALLSLRSQFRAINILLAVIAISVTVFLIIKSAKQLKKYLGEGVIVTLQKVFGFILVSIAVKLFMSNIMGLINQIH